jgi:hypothetical protein
MVPEVVLLFLKKLSYGWGPTVWEERVLGTEEVEEEGICRVVEETHLVVEEEAVTQIRQKRHTIFSSKERTVGMENSN